MSVQCTQGTFDTLVIKVILESFGAFRFLTSLYLENGWTERNGLRDLGLGGEYSVYTGYF